MDLVDRVKKILMTPVTEWPIIATESGDVAGLYSGYIVPLAAIPAVCGFVGNALLGFGVFRGLWSAILIFAMALIGVYVLALIIDWLTPTFGGRRDMAQALKLATYSQTASWLGGVFLLIPPLAILRLIAGLYSLYLLYLGAPVLMNVPSDRALGFTVAVVVAAIIIAVLAVVLIGLLGGVAMMR